MPKPPTAAQDNGPHLEPAKNRSPSFLRVLRILRLVRKLERMSSPAAA